MASCPLARVVPWHPGPAPTTDSAHDTRRQLTFLRVCIYYMHVLVSEREYSYMYIHVLDIVTVCVCVYACGYTVHNMKGLPQRE